MRPRLACPVAGVLLFLAGSPLPGALAASLPDGFGGIRVGATWSEAESLLSPRALDIPLGRQDREARACGYREGRVQTRNGTLHLTSHDFVITELRYSTRLREGSRPLEVASLVRKTYGVPHRETRRDALGREASAGAPTAHVMLEYGGEHPVRFSLSGAPLWRYQVTVTFRDRLLHENRGARCARAAHTQRAEQAR